MKRRMGFVSNSSSSSFCLVGVELSGDIENILKPELLDEYNELGDVEEFFSRRGLQYDSGENGDAVGLDIYDMPEESTLEEFRAKVWSLLKGALANPKKPSIIVDGSYNG